MQIEFGSTLSAGAISSSADLSITKNCSLSAGGNFNGLVSVEIHPLNSLRYLYAYRYIFGGTTPKDKNYYIKELTIKNSSEFPKAIHIQKSVTDKGATTIHPFVLLPNVTIVIKFPTVNIDDQRMGSNVVSSSVDSFSGDFLMIATPVFIAGNASGASSLSHKGPNRRLFYNRLFDYRNDLNNLHGMNLTQNAVFPQNATLDLSNAPILMYHNADSYFANSAGSQSNLSVNQGLGDLDRCPFEVIPAGTAANKILSLPDKCTRTDLRNTMISEFLLPAPNNKIIADNIVAQAYVRQNDTSIYLRNDYTMNKATEYGAGRGMLIIPCSYRPNYHSKIARIITKITM